MQTLVVLYSFFMESSPALDALAKRLSQHPQLASLAAVLLDAAGPLSFIAAQALYMSQPALGAFLPSEEIGALADVLQDPAQAQALARRLEVGAR